MEVLWRSPSGYFQSSLRDFSSVEFLPRTASWAKFSRPRSTSSGQALRDSFHFAIGAHAHTLTLSGIRYPWDGLKPCSSFRDAHSLGNASWAGGTNRGRSRLRDLRDRSMHRRKSHPHERGRSKTGRKRGREKIYNRRAGGGRPQGQIRTTCVSAFAPSAGDRRA